MTRQQVIISGAGLSGLTLGIALAHRDWDVQIFERSADLREVGAGLYTWENGLKVLETINIFDVACQNIEFISSLNMIDKDYGLINSTKFSSESRFCVIPRPEIHRALVQACKAAGVKIETNANIVSADPMGSVQLKNGRVVKADLIVGADGVHSKTRDSLKILDRKETINNGAWRALIPRIDEDKLGIAEEHWNDYRRIGIAPSTDEYRYVYLTGMTEDEEAFSHPFNKEVWLNSFPHLESVINRIDGARLDKNFYYIYLNSWKEGRVAILGDAAHGMEPNLGQGAGVSITSALELAIQLEYYDIDTALIKWEELKRPTADYTQMFSRLYGASASNWPKELLKIRPEILNKALGSDNIDSMMSLAARYVTGQNVPVR